MCMIEISKSTQWTVAMHELFPEICTYNTWAHLVQFLYIWLFGHTPASRTSERQRSLVVAGG